MNALSDLWPYLVLIVVGFLPSDLWRFLGLVLARGVDEGSELMNWVRAVATAVLAGVIAKIVLFAPAALAMVPLGIRLAAIAVGSLAFALVGRSVLAGLVAGEATLFAGALLFAP